MAPTTSNRQLLTLTLMLGVALIVVIGLMVVAWKANLQSIRADQRRIERVVASNYLALIEECDRLNILRAETNRSAYGDYVLDIVVLSGFRSAPHTALERRFDRLFWPELKFAARSKEWTPITDCRQAVNTFGVKYRAPQPIPFTKQLPPASERGGPLGISNQAGG